MLYPKHSEFMAKTNFIFDAEPKNDDINESYIADIEEFLHTNNYVPKEAISSLLDYVTYYSRIKNVTPPETPLTSPMVAKCSPTSKTICDFMQKIGIEADQANVGDMYAKEGIHQISIVTIPTMEENEFVYKEYLMDPTFRQFCIQEENTKDRYYGEKKGGVRMATPHPGYFLNLTEKGKNFANNLIRNGYFEVNDENLKTYFDAFSLYLTPKESYENGMEGTISTTSISGEDYTKSLHSILNKTKSFGPDIEIVTPLDKRNKTSIIKQVFKRIFINPNEKYKVDSNMLIKQNNHSL